MKNTKKLIGAINSGEHRVDPPVHGALTPGGCYAHRDRLLKLDLMSKALQGDGKRLRIRVGDYRLIYRGEDDRLVVLVVKAGHRREVYK